MQTVENVITGKVKQETEIQTNERGNVIMVLFVTSWIRNYSTGLRRRSKQATEFIRRQINCLLM